MKDEESNNLIDNQDWQKRFRAMRKRKGWTYKDLSKITGLEPSSIRHATCGNRFSRHLKLAVFVYEQSEADKEK